MTGGFKEAYRSTRPMIERTIAWLVYGSSRRLRYRGSEKNRIWLTVRVAAINLSVSSTSVLPTTARAG